jgi:cobalt-zinc-cadmium resistance protein CzcA
MLNRLITASLRNRLVVCVATVLLVLLGLRSLLHLPVDAFPDTTPAQVQVNTTVPAMNPEEIEHQVTAPIEQAISGLPGLVNARSVSKFGLSQVVATFDDRTPIYLARQLIMERLQTVELPEGIARPQLGPISTGLGEVFHYVVRSTNSSRSLTDLRELQDWVIKPELRKVPGVAEINTWGGYEKQFHVVVEPRNLVKLGVTFEALVEALKANNQNVGGGQVVRGGESLLVHGIGLTTDTRQIGDIVIKAHEGVPVRVRDVAAVKVDHEIRRGAVTGGGRGEIVLGLGFMLMGENSAEVTRALKQRLAGVRKILPPDVQVETLYDRTELVEKVIRTVEHNLFTGALLVIAVLFAFLGNLRAGLIAASAIPFSMLFAGNLMLQTGVTASLLSLGALDFGLVVDGSVVMLENAMRRMVERQKELGRALRRGERLETVLAAALEVGKPVAYGVGIILVVFLPILTLEGVEGKMFKPMALTMIYALGGSLLLALVLVPALAASLLSRQLRTREPWLVRTCARVYRPLLDAALRFRCLVLIGATAVVVLAGILASRMGGEFLPKLGEQAIVGTSVRLAGVSVDEAAAQNSRLEQLLLEEFPDEIEKVWTRIGTAEVATDPMGIELADFFLALKPRDQWRKARTQGELVEAMRKFFERVPGLRVAFSQPIEMRMNELVAGIRSDIGLKIYGDDLEQLRALADDVQQALARVRGASDVTSEQLIGQPVLQVRLNAEAVARFGVSRRGVLNLVEAVGTMEVGEIREGMRRFPLVVRLPDEQRTDPEALAHTLIPTETGSVLPLNRVAEVIETEGPSTINREWGRRRVTVQCNVRGRDVAGFVEEARRRIASQVKLPEGYSIEWGGQFENMERANRKLRFVVPLALGLILVLLYFNLRSFREVLVVATGIPLGAVGGVLALWLGDMPFTVSSAVGFIALSGVAILNGLVLVSFIHQRLGSGLTLEAAVREGCLVRLRPVLMTGLVAAVGFIPMALNVGVGGEVQRPLATVVIGGVISNTALTLLVLPTLYTVILRQRRSGAGEAPAPKNGRNSPETVSAA